MKSTTFAIIAIAAVAVLLIATTALTSLTYPAFAGGHKRSFRQTAAQSCVNENARCHGVLSQIQGHDNAAIVTGNQP
jgi:hypothetical protein